MGLLQSTLIQSERAYVMVELRTLSGWGRTGFNRVGREKWGGREKMPVIGPGGLRKQQK